MRSLLLLFLLTTACSAQTTPSFAVATVKPAPEGTASNGHWTAPGLGSFSARSVTLALLLQLAYDINDEQIANKPPWLETALYDVDAKPEPGVKLSRDELKPMLQNLLRERFHLQAHEAVEQQKGYALVVAKGGIKFGPTTSGKRLNFRVQVSSDHIEGLNWTMQFLTMQLANAAGSPVVNRTELAGPLL